MREHIEVTTEKDGGKRLLNIDAIDQVVFLTEERCGLVVRNEYLLVQHSGEQLQKMVKRATRASVGMMGAEVQLDGKDVQVGVNTRGAKEKRRNQFTKGR